MIAGIRDNKGRLFDQTSLESSDKQQMQTLYFKEQQDNAVQEQNRLRTQMGAKREIGAPRSASRKKGWCKKKKTETNLLRSFLLVRPTRLELVPG